MPPSLSGTVLNPAPMRRAGILLHPTSLPGDGPCGDLGDGAYRFLDFLQRAGASLWQILPLNPPSGSGFSPYASPSAFAAGTHLLSVDRLARDGLLPGADLRPPAGPPDRVELDSLEKWHAPLVAAAARRFVQEDPGAVDAFAATHPWVDEWALFRAVTREVGGVGWWQLPRDLQSRKPDALALARDRHAVDIRTEIASQLLFHRQWSELRAAAAARGIQIVGDLPIFVAGDGCDTWVWRDLFRGKRDTHDNWRPDPVTGVPPDYFAKTGQCWGNPHYDWPRHERSGFAWWVDRFRTTFELVDTVRVDHFRGFEAAWEIPASAEGDARLGAWRKAPGRALFEAVRRELGALPLIAEDLGIITPEVETLRDDLGLPGMKVLQFAFGEGPAHVFLPHNYTHPRWVAYTGTHDNDTAVGWYRGTDDVVRHRFRTTVARDGSEPAWDLIRLAWSSIALWSVAPFQDLLSLGNEARMNIPGLMDGNWTWRATDLPDWAADRLREMAWAYGRLQGG